MYIIDLLFTCLLKCCEIVSQMCKRTFNFFLLYQENEAVCFFNLQDLGSEIDICALQGDEGLRKKVLELERCWENLKRIEAKAQDWNVARNNRFFLEEVAYLEKQLYEQTRRALVMCAKHKCSNVELVVKVVKGLKAITVRGVDFLLLPELALMDNGQFVSLRYPEVYANPEFVEFYILSFKKARKLYYGSRLENDIFEVFFSSFFPGRPIELLQLLLRYGAGLGEPLYTNPERAVAMLLINIVAVVINEQDNGSVPLGDRRKLQEMVDMIKKSVQLNSDLVMSCFEEAIVRFDIWLADSFYHSFDFDVPKVEECFQILESRELFNCKEPFQVQSLKQICKFNIREILNKNWELPEGIYKLERIPRPLKCYLDLKTD